MNEFNFEISLRKIINIVIGIPFANWAYVENYLGKEDIQAYESKRDGQIITLIRENNEPITLWIEGVKIIDNNNSRTCYEELMTIYENLNRIRISISENERIGQIINIAQKFK